MMARVGVGQGPGDHAAVSFAGLLNCLDPAPTYTLKVEGKCKKKKMALAGTSNIRERSGSPLLFDRPLGLVNGFLSHTNIV